MSDEGQSFWFGVLLAAIGFSILAYMHFSSLEGRCEQKHNVYDCQWTQNPYTPTPSANKGEDQ